MAAKKFPEVGAKAPAFTLPSDTEGDVSLKDFKGEKNVVLYFYPKDNTPGCTTQACAFQALMPKLKKLDTVVIGISPDSIKSHEKFREKFGLKFILVADEGHKIADQYGVWVEKKNYGKTYMGIQRSTLIINKEGVVTHAWPKVSVAGHDEAVLAALKEL